MNGCHDYAENEFPPADVGGRQSNLLLSEFQLLHGRLSPGK